MIRIRILDSAGTWSVYQMIQSLEPGYARKFRIRIRILDSAGTWSVSEMISADIPISSNFH